MRTNFCKNSNNRSRRCCNMEKNVTLFGCEEQRFQPTQTDLEQTSWQLRMTASRQVTNTSSSHFFYSLRLCALLLSFPGLCLTFLSSSLFTSSLSSCHISQQLLGSDGWSPQCETLTCSLVTDYPGALMCCSLKAHRHTGVHKQTCTRLRSCWDAEEF